MRNLMAAVLLLVLAVACGGEGTSVIVEADSTGWESLANVGIMHLPVGDSVVTNTDTDLYDRPNGNDIGDIVAGVPGLVTRSKDGWAEVDFSNGQSGVVIEAHLSEWPGGGGGEPLALFSWSTNDLEVTFTDESVDEGIIETWLWEFGDAGLSGMQHPVHTYAAAGTYTVTLTVTDDDGLQDTHSIGIPVTETPPPCEEDCGGLADGLLHNGMSNTRQTTRGIEAIALDPSEPNHAAAAEISAIYQKPRRKGQNGHGSICTWAGTAGSGNQSLFLQNDFLDGLDQFPNPSLVLFEIAVGRRDPSAIEDLKQCGRDAIANLRSWGYDGPVAVYGMLQFEYEGASCSQSTIPTLQLHAATIAATLVSEGLAIEGPDPVVVTNPSHIYSDGCHYDPYFSGTWFDPANYPAGSGVRFAGNHIIEWLEANYSL